MACPDIPLSGRTESEDMNSAAGDDAHSTESSRPGDFHDAASSSVRGKRKQHHRPHDSAATRAVILKAATAIITEKGISAASLSEIAKEAGVTKSLIHHHFGTKDNLWIEVKNETFKAYYEAQAEMIRSHQDDPDLLRKSMELYFKFLSSNPDFRRLNAWAIAERDTTRQELGLDLTAQGVERITAAQESGRIRSDIDPAMVMIMFRILNEYWFYVRGQIRDHMDTSLDDAAADRHYHENMMKLFFSGLAPGNAAPDEE